MTDTYCKLDGKIVFSSMWEEDGDTCKVWVTLLALKDPFTGIVPQNITGIARLAKLPLEKVEEAFRKFQEPDPNSSSSEEEGRRLVKVPEGWWVVNSQKYSELGWSDSKKEYERQRKAEYRARKFGSTEQPEKKKEDPKPTRTFRPPSREELNMEAIRIGLPEAEVDKFVLHYSSNGWKVGKNSMKCWKSSLAGWKTRYLERNQPTARKNVDHRSLQEHIDIPVL